VPRGGFFNLDGQWMSKTRESYLIYSVDVTLKTIASGIDPQLNEH